MEKKKYLSGKLLIAWLLLVVLLVPGYGTAAATDDMRISLDFQDVELVDMISTISELTGKNFLFDESVRGRVSILSPEPVSLDEAYRLFLTVLRVRGFTVVSSGAVNKIVALAAAKEETLPITDQRGLGDLHVTRILELRYLDAAVAVETILRPLMPRTSHVVAHQATNAIIITDTAENIERLQRLLLALDRTWDRERIELVTLQYAGVVDTAALVMSILEGDGAAVAGRSARQTQTTRRRIAGQIIPYERTNTLALQGEPAFIVKAKELIAQLDVEVESEFSGVHVYYLEHAEAEKLAETVNQIVAGAGRTTPAARGAEGQQATELFRNVKVTADKPTNSLIISAGQDELRNVMSLVSQLDIKRKQVFVEALIMELSMDAVLELGTALQGAVDLGSDSVIIGGIGATRSPDSGSLVGADGQIVSVLQQAVSGIMVGGLFNPITTIINGETVTIPAVSALINLSERDSDVNVLSAPRLLASDNEEAEIVVGRNVPIITSRSETTGGNPINTIERQDAALILRFTPQITAGNLVRMRIHQEISNVEAPSAATGDPNTVGPTLTKTLLRNSIVARDGETVVLGGLFKNQTSRSVNKVPLLGDIPLLGWLFKSARDREEKTSLLIFITPRVIHDSDDLRRLTNDMQRDLQLFRSEGGSEVFFERQRLRTIGDFSVPLEN